MCTWLSLIDLGDREMVVDPTFVLGLNLGIRRAALLAAGGFHPLARRRRNGTGAEIS
jgi:hypothetical protein